MDIRYRRVGHNKKYINIYICELLLYLFINYVTRSIVLWCQLITNI